jgi:hypothetical protein
MLSSRKHQDNISKLVYKSDFDKVKGKDTTKKLDEILHTLWAEAQDQKHEKSLAFNAFGTACVRMVLHLLQKEKAAKQDTFESFQEIVCRSSKMTCLEVVYLPHLQPHLF